MPNLPKRTNESRLINRCGCEKTNDTPVGKLKSPNLPNNINGGGDKNMLEYIKNLRKSMYSDTSMYSNVDISPFSPNTIKAVEAEDKELSGGSENNYISSIDTMSPFSPNTIKAVEAEDKELSGGSDYQYMMHMPTIHSSKNIYIQNKIKYMNIKHDNYNYR
jgi:hypothetical protein